MVVVKEVVEVVEVEEEEVFQLEDHGE